MARMWPDCLLLHSTTMIQASRVAKSRRDTLLLNISRFFRPNCLKYFPNSVKILITINCSLSFFLLQFCIGAFPISLFATPGPSVRPITLRAVWHTSNNHGVPHIVANVLYPPLCLAAQGRLMCLGHGHNLVSVKFAPSSATDYLINSMSPIFWGKLYFQGPTLDL